MILQLAQRWYPLATIMTLGYWTICQCYVCLLFKCEISRPETILFCQLKVFSPHGNIVSNDLWWNIQHNDLMLKWLLLLFGYGGVTSYCFDFKLSSGGPFYGLSMYKNDGWNGFGWNIIEVLQNHALATLLRFPAKSMSSSSNFAW